MIDGICADVAAVKGAMEQIYLRMVGGSILVVYEGDPEVLKLALSGEVDAGSRPPAYRVKLIDFAHTKSRVSRMGWTKV